MPRRLEVREGLIHQFIDRLPLSPHHQSPSVLVLGRYLLLFPAVRLEDSCGHPFVASVGICGRIGEGTFTDEGAQDFRKDLLQPWKDLLHKGDVKRVPEQMETANHRTIVGMVEPPDDPNVEEQLNHFVYLGMIRLLKFRSCLERRVLLNLDSDPLLLSPINIDRGKVDVMAESDFLRTGKSRLNLALGGTSPIGKGEDLSELLNDFCIHLNFPFFVSVDVL